MSSPEVDWVLDQFGDVVDAVSEPLQRVDRDASQVYEGGDPLDMTQPVRELTSELKQANIVGATLADRSVEAIGTEFDHRVETVVGVRVLGLSHTEWGHVDPSGSDGIVFDELVGQLRDAVAAGRQYPDVGRQNTTYHSAFVENDTPLSSAYQDAWRATFDVRLVGYRDLP